VVGGNEQDVFELGEMEEVGADHQVACEIERAAGFGSKFLTKGSFAGVRRERCERMEGKFHGA
jgi:hypothetical protein